MRESASLRYIFNEVAELYDEVRPGYPDEIIDAVITLAELPADGKILEIGAGTGQITLPFAERGPTILALEPGPDLAAVAARKLRSYFRVEIVRTPFEEWTMEPGAFDLVLSAQAFHWIDPDFGCARAAHALRSGGSIALVWNLDVSSDTPFWRASQPIYDRYFSGGGTGSGLSLAEKGELSRDALIRSPQFSDPMERRCSWEHVYSGADYLKLLNTYSDHRALPEPERGEFFAAMAVAIDRAGGVVRRKYETLLLLARRH